jgi:hypothetical protein
MLDPESLTNGREQYEEFTIALGRKKKSKFQYDYRHQNGELFSIVKSTLAECREARDHWLASKRTQACPQLNAHHNTILAQTNHDMQ